MLVFYTAILKLAHTHTCRCIYIESDLSYIYSVRIQPTASLDMEDIMDLDLFENHKQVKEINDFECRSWQSDILEYVNNQMENKVIWVVGDKGNEGDTFFHSNIHEEFGYSRNNSRPHGENTKSTFHIFGTLNCLDNAAFILNVAKGYYLCNGQYEWIQKQSMMFGHLKKREVFIVFANSEPDMEKISDYGWIILKFSEDSKCLKEINGDSCKLRYGEELEYDMFIDDCL